MRFSFYYIIGEHKMPYYDYTCQTCNYNFEKFLSIENYLIPTQEPCPKCSTQNVTKDICSPAIGDPVRLGITKPPSDFSKYVLGRMKHDYKNSKIDARIPIAKEI